MKEKVFAAVQKFITSDNEFSKRFTISIRNFMFGHVTVSVIASIVLTCLCFDPVGIVDILTAMMPVYIALQGANYVKSGFENWKKITMNADSDVSESEDG